MECGTEHAVLQNVKQGRALKTARVRSELDGLHVKVDIKQPKKEVTIWLNKNWSMMCCCPERFETVSVDNRMRG